MRCARDRRFCAAAAVVDNCQFRSAISALAACQIQKDHTFAHALYFDPDTQVGSAPKLRARDKSASL